MLTRTALHGATQEDFAPHCLINNLDYCNRYKIFVQGIELKLLRLVIIAHAGVQ